MLTLQPNCHDAVQTSVEDRPHRSRPCPSLEVRTQIWCLSRGVVSALDVVRIRNQLSISNSPVLGGPRRLQSPSSKYFELLQASMVVNLFLCFRSQGFLSSKHRRPYSVFESMLTVESLLQDNGLPINGLFQWCKESG